MVALLFEEVIELGKLSNEHCLEHRLDARLSAVRVLGNQSGDMLLRSLDEVGERFAVTGFDQRIDLGRILAAACRLCIAASTDHEQEHERNSIAESSCHTRSSDPREVRLRISNRI